MRAVIFVTCSELCSLLTPHLDAHQLCLGISLGFCPAHHTQVSHYSFLPGCRNDDKFTSEGTLSSGTCNHFLWLYLTQPADLLHGCFPLGRGVLSAHWENISISYLHGLGGAGGTILVLTAASLVSSGDSCTSFQSLLFFMPTLTSIITSLPVSG